MLTKCSLIKKFKMDPAITWIAGVPAEGNPPSAVGVRKGENRDAPHSFRAIGFADAQDINHEAMDAVLSGNGCKRY